MAISWTNLDLQESILKMINQLKKTVIEMFLEIIDHQSFQEIRQPVIDSSVSVMRHWKLSLLKAKVDSLAFAWLITKKQLKIQRE